MFVVPRPFSFFLEIGSGDFTRIGTTLNLVTCAVSCCAMLVKFVVEIHSFVALLSINANITYIESIRNTAANL